MNEFYSNLIWVNFWSNIINKWNLEYFSFCLYRINVNVEMSILSFIYSFSIVNILFSIDVTRKNSMVTIWQDWCRSYFSLANQESLILKLICDCCNLNLLYVKYSWWLSFGRILHRCKTSSFNIKKREEQKIFTDKKFCESLNFFRNNFKIKKDFYLMLMK